MTENNNNPNETPTDDTTLDDATLDEAMSNPKMIEALVAEIQDRAAISKQYMDERDNAKTKTKREHFHKKLVRNNEEAADILLTLEKLIEEKEANGDVDDQRHSS